jgi:2-polyprenyl-3-methyl-5-hydroxy-6-metoxy-1,4-benzoquinol methylase
VSSFAPITESLRDELSRFYAEEEPLSQADRTTIETNSTHVPRRGEPMAELVRAKLARESLRGLDVLDVGCGFGALSLFFAADGARVRGIDPHHERFVVGQSVAARHGLDVRFDPGYIEDIAYPDASFDVVLMNNSLCYIVDRNDRRDALRQVIRVLRPGGVLALRNPNRLYPLDQFTRLPLIQLLPPRAASALGERLRGHRSKVRLTTPAGARRELERAGFADVESHGFISRPRTAPLRSFARYHHQVARRPTEQTISSPA